MIPACSTWHCLASVVALTMTTPAFAAPTPQKPNIVIILADDLGYSDTGCFGGEIDTPNINALASEGLRFTQFYNGARCCPSRASLLTGLYAHQTGMGHMMFERNLPGYHGDLNKQCATIGEVLGDAGYRTYAVGKWHLTRFDKPDSSQHNWPLQRGFEKYYGLIWGYASYFDPGICRGNKWYSCENDPDYKPEKYYFTNALTDNAVTFLKQHKQESPDKPFFMYLAYTAAHWPLHALDADIAKYKGRFDAGYDKLRQARYERLKKAGIIDANWQLSPTAESWDNVKNREWELRCMEVYAAMIDRMDQGIGRVTAELKRQGAWDNTLILFLQDNGACAEDRGRAESAAAPAGTLRPLTPDELPASSIPKQTRDGRPMRTGPEVMPGGPDSYIAYGRAWANVSNTPFREYKHWVHEGGISTPLIAHWPAGISAALDNQLTSVPAHLIDIMPTCLDIAQTTYPAERKGEKLTPLQGISLRPIFQASPIDRKNPLFWDHEGNRAVRQGKWKLVAKANGPWELYDMESDRTEMHDLAAQHPDHVKQLSEAWDAWAARSNVLPLGGWDKKAPADAPAKAAVSRFTSSTMLSGDASPRIHDSALTITVGLAKAHGDGVLISQGAKLHGFTLYVEGGKLQFAIRRDGESHLVSGETVPVDSATTIVAALGPKGRARLLIDAREVGSAKTGFIARTPAQGLSVGRDSEDPVGVYPGEFPYPGEIEQVLLETSPVAPGSTSSAD